MIVRHSETAQDVSGNTGPHAGGGASCPVLRSVALGGVPHDTYGMTTSSVHTSVWSENADLKQKSIPSLASSQVHTYVTELLRELGEDESRMTKFQTGGPDGDLGSNEILISKDMTTGIVDGSGVLYDPSGICRAELTRLAQRRVPIKEFNRCFLGNGAFLVTVDESNVTLPDGSTWLTGAELRDNFHLTDYAAADLFVPCGGRPNAALASALLALMCPSAFFVYDLFGLHVALVGRLVRHSMSHSLFLPLYLSFSLSFS